MHQALGIENLRLCDMPLFHYVEFAGIHPAAYSKQFKRGMSYKLR